MFELPRSVLRNVPLLFAAAPRTPLRVLSLMSLDTLHRMRTCRPLPRGRMLDLALFVDFQGCANAEFDRKHLCESEYEATRQKLEDRGLGARATAYLQQLDKLERRKPPIGGNDGNFERVAAYREAVARLDVTTLATIALEDPIDGTKPPSPGLWWSAVASREGGAPACVDGPFRAGSADADIDALVRILLQCQIIDDVIDYEQDLAAGLPSFLTACVPLPRALELTTAAARSHGSGPSSSSSARLPYRVALWLFAAVAKLLLWTSSRRAAAEELTYAPPVAHKIR